MSFWLPDCSLLQTIKFLILEKLWTATKIQHSDRAWTNNHSIYFENVGVIDKGDHRVRKTLKSWLTTMTN